MNRQNAIRHALKECKKIKTYEQYDEAYKLFVDDSCLWGIWLNKCDNCECDDFGYCLLNDDKYDGYAELNYCLPALIEKLEDGLQRLMKKEYSFFPELCDHPTEKGGVRNESNTLND